MGSSHIGTLGTANWLIAIQWCSKSTEVIFPHFFIKHHILGRFRCWPRGHSDDLSSMILPWSDLFQLWFPPRKRNATSSSGLGLGWRCGAWSNPASPEADKASTPTRDFLEAWSRRIRETAREHFALSKVSGQVSWLRLAMGVGCLATRILGSHWSIVKNLKWPPRSLYLRLFLKHNLLRGAPGCWLLPRFLTMCTSGHSYTNMTCPSNYLCLHICVIISTKNI